MKLFTDLIPEKNFHTHDFAFSKIQDHHSLLRINFNIAVS